MMAEVVLAQDFGARFTPGTLVLADRGFYSFALWAKASAAGADLLWRKRSNQVLPVARRLRDGSFLSTIYPSQADRRAGRGGVTVRVIEYRITTAEAAPAQPFPAPLAESGTASEPACEGADDQADDGDGDAADREAVYRMVTTILDPAAAPAAELAALYGERWEIEDTLDELKTHQRSPRLVLRSKQPDGVIQEIYGYFCVHYAIRWLMHTVAPATPIPTRTASPSSEPSGPRGAAPRHTRVFPPDVLNSTQARAGEELLHELLPARRRRRNPRVVKRKMSNWAVKRPEHLNPPQPPPTKILIEVK